MSPGITVLNNKNDCNNKKDRKPKKTSQETIALTKDDKSSLLVYKLKMINCALLKAHTSTINRKLITSLTIKDSDITSLSNVNNLLHSITLLFIYGSKIDKLALDNCRYNMVIQSNRLSSEAALELISYGERLLDEKTDSEIINRDALTLQKKLDQLGIALFNAEKKSLIIQNNTVFEK